MKPSHLPGLPTVAALMLSAMIAVWLGVSGPLNLSALQTWQTLIVGILALLGVGATATIAVRNVTRQIRISILSREEDRIERELPGLRDARYFCSRFLYFRVTNSYVGITQAFADEGFGVPDSTLQKDVQNALPDTDPATCHRVQRKLAACFRWARNAEMTRVQITADRERIANPEEWAPGEIVKVEADIEATLTIFNTAVGKYSEAMDELEDEIVAINRKIALYETRRSRIRKEVEEYFDDE
jgi:hypothetical protein